jgi:hypothetical protein
MVTQEQLESMTVGELFALADKVGGALRTLAEARALVGGPTVAPVAAAPAPMALTGPGWETAPQVAVVAWSPQEQAERANFARQRAAEQAKADADALAAMPENIQRAARTA